MLTHSTSLRNYNTVFLITSQNRAPHFYVRDSCNRGGYLDGGQNRLASGGHRAGTFQVVQHLDVADMFYNNVIKLVSANGRDKPMLRTDMVASDTQDEASDGSYEANTPRENSKSTMP